MIQLPPLTQYLLETSICLLVLYIVYRILFQKNTFFQLNRIYLLTGAMFSFLIPLLHFTWQQEEIEALIPVVYGSEFMIYEFNEGLQQAAPMFSITLGQILLTIYTLGVLFFTSKFIQRLYKLYLITQYSPKEEKDGILTLHTEETDTASFFNWLFFNPRHQHDDSHLILEHELVHIRQWHSADVMIMEVLVILNWFNPVIHLYNRSLRETHEFIADKIVSSLAHSKYDYAKLLVEEVGKSINPALTNTFASLIKKRLIMLSTKNSRKRKGLYYLAILPAFLLLITLFSFNVADPISGLGELSSRIEKVAETPIVTNNKTLVLSEEKTPLLEVETLTSIEEEEIDLGKVLFEKRNDGYYLNIENIASFPANEIRLFDRYGNERIKLENYKNDWSASILEEATYFYVFKSGDIKHQGYVYLDKTKKRMAKIQLGSNLEIEQELGEDEERPSFSMKMTLSVFKILALDEELPIIPLMFIDGEVKELRNTEMTIAPLKNGDAIRAKLNKQPVNKNLPGLIKGVGTGMNLYFDQIENGERYSFLVIEIIEDTKSNIPTESMEKSIEIIYPHGPVTMPYYGNCSSYKDGERKECSDKAVINFISNNVKYPAEARKKGIEGTAVVRFVVKKDGTLSFNEDMTKTILRNPGGGCGEEALRVVKLMDEWTAGEKDGKKVDVEYTLPIKFKLADGGNTAPIPPRFFKVEGELNTSTPKNGIYKIVEYMPHFPGCEDLTDKNARKKCSDNKIIDFINTNIKYPEAARKKGEEGTAVVRFVVQKDGSLSFSNDMKKVILRNPGTGLGEEAFRVIKMMPNWTPGKQNGEAVAVQFTMPIKFQLADDEEEMPIAPKPAAE